MQLVGRTTSDQIVVFDGPAEMEGRIVNVRIQATHGMTLFARADQSSDVAEREPAIAVG